jgi:hypothetical protein
MTPNKFNRMHENWLQSGNPADDPDLILCEFCEEPMEFGEDFDYDEDTGRVVSVGSSWSCCNQKCTGQHQEK